MKPLTHSGFTLKTFSLKNYFMKNVLTILVCLLFLGSFSAGQINVLIVDGQNNHAVWPKSTIMMRQYLEETGLFSVDIYRTKYTWRAQREAAFLPLTKLGETENLEAPKADPGFLPDFKKYDVVISNFGNTACDWPEETRNSFEKYMKRGGGFVSVHAADNSFPDWEEYNKMIGLGGWGNRTEDAGGMVVSNR